MLDLPKLERTVGVSMTQGKRKWGEFPGTMGAGVSRCWGPVGWLEPWWMPLSRKESWKHRPLQRGGPEARRPNISGTGRFIPVSGPWDLETDVALLQHCSQIICFAFVPKYVSLNANRGRFGNKTQNHFLWTWKAKFITSLSTKWKWFAFLKMVCWTNVFKMQQIIAIIVPTLKKNYQQIDRCSENVFIHFSLRRWNLRWNCLGRETFNLLVLMLFGAVPEISFEVSAEKLPWNTCYYTAHRGDAGVLVHLHNLSGLRREINLDFTPKKSTHALEGVGCFHLVDSVNLGDDHLSSCYLSLGSWQSSLVPV